MWGWVDVKPVKLKGNVNEELKDVKSEPNNYKTIFEVEVLGCEERLGRNQERTFLVLLFVI